MGDEAAQLLEASTLPWEDRFVHKFWKARVAAYEAVVKECSLHATVEDSDCLKAFGPLARHAAGDTNANALDFGLDALVAFLGVADEQYAKTHAAAIMANVAGKGLSGRAKTVERATEVSYVLCELEAGDIVAEALLKAAKHKVPKLALASIEALLSVTRAFGTGPGAIPPKPILKGIAHLFESKDGKIRDTAKELTVELVRWLGVDVVRKDLLEKMRAGMRVEVQESIALVVPGAARPARMTRAQQANPPSTPMELDDTATHPAEDGAQNTHLQSVIPEAYEFADPEQVLDTLEKAPADKGQPKFWDAVVSAKWKERLNALSQLRELCDHPKLASGEYGDIARALKKIITKDSNIACVGEACAAAGALAEGLRREFRGEARVLLPGMLDKLKDKNTSVVTKNRDALLVFSNRCFSVTEVVDEITTALQHKFPKVPAQTCLWLAAAAQGFDKNQAADVASHKVLVPALVKCAEHKDKDVRACVLETLVAIGNFSGGFKAIAKQCDGLDEQKKAKLERACAASAKKGSADNKSKPLVNVDVHKPPVSVVAKSARPGTARPTTAKPQTVTAVTAGEDVDPPPALGETETREKLSNLYGNEVVTQLSSGMWKDRLAGMTVIFEQIQAMDTDSANGAVEHTVRGLATTPGFDDSNFQVLSKVFEVFGALAKKATSFSKKDGACVVSGVTEKLTDVKLRAPGTVALVNVAEALGPAFLFARLRVGADGAKNPKVTSEALLFCAGVVAEFGVHACGVALAIDWCKASLGLTNPACKAAAAKMLGAMHAGLGPGLKDFLADVSAVQMKVLEAEFLSNPFDGNGKTWRTVRVSEESVDKSSEVGKSDGGLPRQDVSPMITDKLLADMADASAPTSWKTRAAAVDAVGVILAGAGFRIAPTTGDLLPALAKRFNDTNRNLAATALVMAGKVAVALGPAAGERRHGHGVAAEITKQMGDSKPQVRAAACGALDAWVIACGLEKTLPVVADKLVDLSGKMSGDGKAEALRWVLAALAGVDADDESVLASAVTAAAVGLADNKAQARAAGAAVMDTVVTLVGSRRATAMCAKMSCPKQLSAAAAAHVEKAGVVVAIADASSAPEPSSSPTLPQRPATARPAGAHKSQTGISSLRHSRPGTARNGGVATSISFVTPDGPALRRNDDKDARLKKLPKKPVKFETLRDDQLALAEGEVKLALAPYVRSDVHALLFQDFKSHLMAMELLEQALVMTPENVHGNLDLLLRWVVLRISEQTPNTQSLLKVLDFTQSVLRSVKDQGGRLSEQEGALFLPALVDKSGHAMDAAREKFRGVLKTVPGLFPASRLAGYLVRGLDSKNTKTRLEALDALELLVERHGLDVVERGGSKALVEIAKLADARDAPTRAAALNCLTVAYKVAGEDAWRHIGRVGALVKDALEDKFTKASKEMARQNEGTPGAWMRAGALVGGGAVGAAPLASALVGKSVSTPGRVGGTPGRFGGTPGRLAATATALGSPIAAVASALLRPIGKAVSSLARRDWRETAKETETRDARPAFDDAYPDETSASASSSVSVEQRLSGWRRALETVATGSDANAVEGMKQLCHEVMGSAGDDAALTAMAPDADALVFQLANRVSSIFDAALAAPGPSTARACRYVLNALMQVFQTPVLAQRVGLESEKRVIGVLLLRLLDPRACEMQEGAALVKALNVLMLKVLEHCPRTNSFNALLRLLVAPPATVTGDENATNRFHELVVKCLIKLTKALGQTLHEVDLPALLREIHDFFHALGEAEIRKRAKAADGGDKPLRMVKTILHKVTEMVGHDIWDAFGACPPRDANPAPIVYVYVDLNLQSMPNAPGTPRVFNASPSPRFEELTRIPSAPMFFSSTVASTPTTVAATPTRVAATPPVVAQQRTPEPEAGAETAAPATPVSVAPASASIFFQAATPKMKTPKASLSSVDGVAPMDADAPPPTPVSADLKSRLANVFKKIGEKTTTGAGLEDLYDFSKQYPMVDIQPHLARTSAAFQSYIRRGLAKVETARSARARAIAAATPRRAAAAMAAPAPPIAPSPMPSMERTAAEVYRERLAQMAASKKDRERRLSDGVAAPTTAATAQPHQRLANITNSPETARVSSASAGLTTLRERMNRIAAKAAGGGSSVSSESLASSVNAPAAPAKTQDGQVTFEDLQARMERIRANSAAGKF